LTDHPHLPRDFYAREPEVVARQLIGAHLIRLIDGQQLVGRIVEAEAYRGAGDAASHAYRGKTTRNAPMFGPPGHAYVYFIYGVHWMFNISAHTHASPGAVLIRALEPLAGLEIMRRHRGGKRDRLLTNGPAKLAQAMAIDDALSGADLCSGADLTLTQGEVSKDEQIVAGPRVRVPGDATAQARPWRYWIKDHPYVSQ
jgi:DNA-3-methyladenine glycosylase